MSSTTGSPQAPIWLPVRAGQAIPAVKASEVGPA